MYRNRACLIHAASETQPPAVHPVRPVRPVHPVQLVHPVRPVHPVHGRSRTQSRTGPQYGFNLLALSHLPFPR